MWDEQREEQKSSFCDEKQLLLPKCRGGHTIPYDLAAGRNTLKFASAVQLYDKDILSKPKSTESYMPTRHSVSATSSPSRTLPGSPEPGWGSSCTAVGIAP